ncbi:MAG: FliM/FliN family flagellar motor switch protein, partial [Actinomycetota bacterium]
ADVRAFDFRHPSTLSRDDARVLQVLQETFAHGVGTMLAAAVRASIDVKIGRIDQTPHGEMVRRSPNPAALTLLRLDPIAPAALLRIDPTLSFALVELLLGGPGTGPHPERAHTEVEEALIGELLHRLMPTLDEAFGPLASVTTSVLAQESNPSFVQITSATDMVVMIGLDVGVDSVRGEMQLIVPVGALRPHLDALASASADSATAAHDAARARELVSAHLANVDVTAVARFEPVLASSQQLIGLEVGDVITLDHQLDTPLVLELDGVPVHEISIGQVRRNFAVQVSGPAPAPRRIANRLGVATAPSTLRDLRGRFPNVPQRSGPDPRRPAATIGTRPQTSRNDRDPTPNVPQRSGPA